MVLESPGSCCEAMIDGLDSQKASGGCCESIIDGLESPGGCREAICILLQRNINICWKLQEAAVNPCLMVWNLQEVAVKPFTNFYN